MRILLVEDEPGIAQFISQGLTEAGHVLDIAKSGREGKNYALSVDYDIIITVAFFWVLEPLTGDRSLKGYQ